jgi:GNAT superfamily N-acetyltransferase
VISPAGLLAAYDAQVRTALASRAPAGVVLDWDPPLMRAAGLHRGFVNYRDLAGLTGADLDALIARTCEYFGARGEAFEWKTHAHDEPADLTDRLRAAGFQPEDLENVMVGLAENLVAEPVLPAAVTIRQVAELADFQRIGQLHSEIWNADWSWLVDDLASRRAADPDDIAVFLAEDTSEPDAPQAISAGWLVRNPGTEFAGLWGGSTLASWRGRGIYRALVARRAQLALRWGSKYLQVDASPDSTPILRRLGLVAVTTTTPYVWTPPPQLPPSTLSG